MFIYTPFLNLRWKPAAFRIQLTKIIYVLFILSILTSTVGMKPAAAVGPCDSPANEIIAENCKTGNPSSEWDISGAGDSTIQGFATDISVNRGGTINFKVDTVASSFQIKIYRLGYYNGLGARLIDTIPDTATTATTQPACTNGGSPDFLVDCGGWSVSASWTAVDRTYDPDINAVSGLYIARLERTDGTSGASHIPFIVRDDDGNSDLLFQTSDTTWQAYNGYGGYSLYAAPNHAHKVSYNRPFSTRSNAPEDYFMNAEYPMLRWLERNGYDVSYFTDVDSDRYGSEILEHKVFLSVGHDEYWSAGQRTAVEAARDAGVHLAFFSGNEIYWKTRWEPSTADGGNTPYRTLVSYKEGDAQGSEHYDCLGNFNCDPDPDTWTGLWRQNQTGHDGGQPENSLSGQISWGDATSAIQVPASATGLRFWRDTGMTGATTLTYGTLGYEFDWEQ
ncbi:MAG TPA: N,N-dimethylformamidase beta subunit family domain-containing protein, partial [Anaerolineales bacterium]|nr:N,N-dimethylformamidase beta subunit family domain-containing protein [Anaerolineales bacterium]